MEPAAPARSNDTRGCPFTPLCAKVHFRGVKMLHFLKKWILGEVRGSNPMLKGTRWNERKPLLPSAPSVPRLLHFGQKLVSQIFSPNLGGQGEEPL